MTANPFLNALVDALTAGKCPDCEAPSTAFLPGPTAGINRNVCCPSCWSAFNVGVFRAQIVSAERIANHHWSDAAGFRPSGAA